MIDFGSMQGGGGKFLRRLLKLLPKNLTLVILQGVAKGKVWKRASGVDGYWLGSYEKKKQQLFTSLIKDGCIVYDIGANVGFYTLVAASAAKNVKVFAFEPEERNYKYLTEHVRLNSIDAVLLPLALSDHDGSERFELGENSATHKLSESGALKVPCRTIDSLVSEGVLMPPQVIKIDVEGAENKVLRGGESTLRKYLPHILVETDSEPVLSFLRTIGYEPEKIAQGEYFARSPRF